MLFAETETYYVAQTGLKLGVILLSQMLELQVYAIVSA